MTAVAPVATSPSQATARYSEASLVWVTKNGNGRDLLHLAGVSKPANQGVSVVANGRLGSQGFVPTSEHVWVTKEGTRRPSVLVQRTDAFNDALKGFDLTKYERFPLGKNSGASDIRRGIVLLAVKDQQGTGMYKLPATEPSVKALQLAAVRLASTVKTVGVPYE
jgi:hypothetical protein